MNDVVKHEPRPLATAPAPYQSESAAIISMIERMASDPTVDIARLEKILELRERVETRNAKIAFTAAVAAAKGEIKPIVRNATGHNAKKYADFSAIAREVDPVLSRHGLSYRFQSRQTDKVAVKCILSHNDGHSEETELCAPADTSGNKNAIQSIGSALTYLQRYSLVLSLGLASSVDDDGNGGGNGGGGGDRDWPETVLPSEAHALELLIKEVGANLPIFLRYYGISSLDELPASKLSTAMSKLHSKKVVK